MPLHVEPLLSPRQAATATTTSLDPGPCSATTWDLMVPWVVPPEDVGIGHWGQHTCRPEPLYHVRAPGTCPVHTHTVLSHQTSYTSSRMRLRRISRQQQAIRQNVAPPESRTLCAYLHRLHAMKPACVSPWFQRPDTSQERGTQSELCGNQVGRELLFGQHAGREGQQVLGVHTAAVSTPLPQGWGGGGEEAPPIWPVEQNSSGNHSWRCPPEQVL